MIDWVIRPVSMDVACQAGRAPAMSFRRTSCGFASGDFSRISPATPAAVAILMQMVSVSPLAFGLGMYLPMELNTPILAGAVVASLVGRSTTDEKEGKARADRGILIASGLIAGAAILGVGKSLLASFGSTKRLLDGMDLTSGMGASAEPAPMSSHASHPPLPLVRM